MLKQFYVIFVLVLLMSGVGLPHESCSGEEKKVEAEKKEHHDDGHGHEADDVNGEEDSAVVSEASQQLGGIRTGKVSRDVVSKTIPLQGRMAQDLDNVVYVSAHAAGVVEEMMVLPGEYVQKDTVLCRVKQEDIRASVAGTVISVFVRDKELVQETTALYAIADMAQLAANFDVYEQDIAAVRMGQAIDVYPLAYPQQKFKGRVVFISPRVEESTYTVRIRCVVENPENLLKLGMSVRGDLVVEQEQAIVIPSKAIQIMNNETVVFKKTSEGFKAQDVHVLSQTPERAVIAKGLNEGDEIVTEGAFVVKSTLLGSEMEHGHCH